MSSFFSSSVSVKSATDKLTRTQQFILLYNELKGNGCDVCRELETLNFSFPDLSLVNIPFLHKNKPEKQKMLLGLRNNINMSEDHLQLSYDILHMEHIIPAFQQALERCYFEKVYWEVKLKKVGG